MSEILGIADQHLEPDITFLEIEKERPKDLGVLHQREESLDLSIHVLYGHCEDNRRRSRFESAQSTQPYLVDLDAYVGSGRIVENTASFQYHPDLSDMICGPEIHPKEVGIEKAFGVSEIRFCKSKGRLFVVGLSALAGKFDSNNDRR
jgi:hypothetical protein